MPVTIGIARETAPGERRVARGAGAAAGLTDDAYAQAGAQIVDSADAALADADLVACVQAPEPARIARLKSGAVLVGVLQPQADAARGEAIATHGIIAFPLERLPRTTRAQA